MVAVVLCVTSLPGKVGEDMVGTRLVWWSLSLSSITNVGTGCSVGGPTVATGVGVAITSAWR